MLFNKLCEDFNQKDSTGECKCILHQVFHWKQNDHRNCKSCKAKNASDALVGPLVPLEKLPPDWRDTLGSKRRKTETKTDSLLPTLKVYFDYHYKKSDKVKYTCQSCHVSQEENIIQFHSFKGFPMTVTCYFPVSLLRFQYDPATERKLIFGHLI